MFMRWGWPVVIIGSTAVTCLSVFTQSGGLIGSLLVMWFVCVCPGMSLVRTFYAGNVAVEWMLALTLSFALDALVAGILLYAEHWSPHTIFAMLALVSLGGVGVQLGRMYSSVLMTEKRFYGLLAVRRKFGNG